MGVHGRAAAHKPKITMRNDKRRLEWCKARRHWTARRSGKAFSEVMNHAPPFWVCQARPNRPTSVPDLTNVSG